MLNETVTFFYRLQHRLADAPQNSIILLEDVDAVFASRDDVRNKKVPSFFVVQLIIN